MKNMSKLATESGSNLLLAKEKIDYNNIEETMKEVQKNGTSISGIYRLWKHVFGHISTHDNDNNSRNSFTKDKRN